MRKMFSEKQIKKMIQESPSEVVKALKGQDINVEGITSKGIANTGNVGITGDLAVSGSINGEENPSLKPIYWHGLDLYKAGTNSVQAHILSNTEEAINTPAKLLSWVKSKEGTTKLACSGIVQISTNYKSIIFIRFQVESSQITNIRIYFYDLTNGYSNLTIAEENFTDYFENVDDSVNKVN